MPLLSTFKCPSFSLVATHSLTAVKSGAGSPRFEIEFWVGSSSIFPLTCKLNLGIVLLSPISRKGNGPGSGGWPRCGSQTKTHDPPSEPFAEMNMAVAQKTGTQNGTLVSGSMDQNLRNPSCLILSHTHMFSMFSCWFLKLEFLRP